MIFYTGDIVSHYLWKANVATNVKVLDEVAALIKKYFPNTPVYSSIGNHDSYPTNRYTTINSLLFFHGCINYFLINEEI